MNTAPLPTACHGSAFPFPTLRRDRASGDRVHRELLRRIDACSERRTALALDPISDLPAWCRERDRGDKLRRALITWLSRPF